MSKYGVFSGPYFPVFGLNTEIYSVNLRIQSEYRKIWTRKNSVYGHFSRSANFNYFPLVWMFSHAKLLKKVEALQKSAPRFLYDKYNSPSGEILKKSGKASIEVNKLRYLCIEIYKSINNINPSFMKQILQLRETNNIVRNQYKLNPSVPKISQVSYGKKDIMGLKSGAPFRFTSRLVKILKTQRLY